MPSDLRGRRLLLLVMSVCAAAVLAGSDERAGVGRLHVVAVAAAAMGGGLPGGLAATLVYMGIKAWVGEDATWDDGVMRAVAATAVSAIVAGLVRAVDANEARVASLERALAESRPREARRG